MSTVRTGNAKHVPPSCLTPVVTRLGLLDAIERQRQKRMLLVQGAAGYGKTLLLAEWRGAVQRSGAVSAWVALEQTDASPERLLASLTSALHESGIGHADGEAGRLATASLSDPFDAFLALAARSTRESWLTLDDWHRAESGPASDLLEALLRNLPPNWHIALSSRIRPKLGLVALRARGQLVEMDQEDLRFSADEARILMASAPLSDGALEELLELTEGWPIALQLAHLWLSEGGDVAALRSSLLDSIDGMAEFIAAEVFADLPAEQQRFMVDSSIFARFSGDLVDFARKRSDSADFIEALRSPGGLIVPTDSRRTWYRHHRVLAEFLRRERRRIPAARVAQLHGRAAVWFEGRKMLFDAVEHARLSGDEARTVQLVEDAGCVDICIQDGAPAVRALLDSLPSDVVRARPRLRAAFTAMNLKLGSIGQAGELLAELQAAADMDDTNSVLRRDLLVVQNLRQCFIDESPSAEDLLDQRRSLEASANADWWVRALLQNVMGRLEMRRGLLREAVHSLAEADRMFEAGGSAQGHFLMLANTSICEFFLGRLESGESFLARAHGVLKDELGDAETYSGIVQTVEALLLYERNELNAAGKAAQLALAGLELAEGCFEQYFGAIQVAARVALAASGLDAAVRTIDRGRKLSRYHLLSRMEGLLDSLQLRLTIDAGQWDVARRLTGRLVTQPSSPQEFSTTEAGWLEHDLIVPVQCLIALRDGRAAYARALAQAMVSRCGAEGRVPAEVRALTIEAIACDAVGDADGTRQALRRAIERASAERLLQPFFEIDGSMLALLREFQRTEATTLPPVQSEFLSGIVLRLIAAGKAKAHTEALTVRESEILKLLGHGGSNKVIARQLDLTENAVKFHLKNVFRKLSVDNRAMAAQVAQRLDLDDAR